MKLGLHTHLLNNTLYVKFYKHTVVALLVFEATLLPLLFTAVAGVVALLFVVLTFVLLKTGKSTFPKALKQAPVALLPFKGTKPSLQRHFLLTGSN